MSLNLLKDTGTPLEKQRFTWRELVQPPFSKLDDDAFTRVRVILMNGIESEAPLSKYDAFGGFTRGPSRDDLKHVGEEEYRHFTLLQSAIEQLGGDPTAVTPSANIQTTAAHGIHEVIVDPRTTLLQSLEAALVVELADNACWEALIDLAQEAGEHDLVQQFQEALKNEQDHLQKVQAWVAAR